MAERIQKYLSRIGVGSRRQIEDWIRRGRIGVDGQQAVLGSAVHQGSLITLDQKVVKVRSNQHAAARVIMYHKPSGEICTRTDPKGRPTVFERLPRLRSARWVSVGRLDFNTSGLLLFTTDGDLAHRLMHPSSGIEREYRCRIHGQTGRDRIERLRQGIKISGRLCCFERIRARGGRGTNRWYDVVVREGRYREVKRMWSAIGCTVNRLIRIRYGALVLPPDLKPGYHRMLNAGQLDDLLRSPGSKTAQPRSQGVSKNVR